MADTADKIVHDLADNYPMHPYRGECVFCGGGGDGDPQVHEATCLWVRANMLLGKELPEGHSIAK